MRKQCYIVLYLLLSSFIVRAQQDANFTQYIFNTVYVNPAYSGYKGNIYLQSTYRKQWSGVEGAPSSFSFSADAALANEKVGLSFIINSDKIGAQSNLSAYGGYAYHIQLNEYSSSKISFGLNIGFIQASLNGRVFDPNEEGDSFIPAANTNSLLPDARFGLLYANDFLFTGISATNLLSKFSFGQQKSEWYVGLKPHLYFLGGLILHASEDIVVKPMFLLKDDFGGPTNLDVNGFILLRERIWIGAMYRTAVKLYDKPHLQKDLSKSSSTGALLELFPSPNIRIGYSFDYSLNKLRNLNNGTHEISIGLYLRDNSNKRGMGFYGCYF